MSLRLHRKYGVNPTVPICFFCGEPTGEVVLLGASYKEEAPSRMVLNYRPCEACQERWKQGITFIEVEPSNLTRNRPEISPGVSPTGRHLVIKEEDVGKILKPGWMFDQIIKARRAFIEKAIFDTFLPEEEHPEKPEDRQGGQNE